jgi:hypothetical protein
LLAVGKRERVGHDANLPSCNAAVRGEPRAKEWNGWATVLLPKGADTVLKLHSSVHGFVGGFR